jgi:hypothetical protein
MIQKIIEEDKVLLVLPKDKKPIDALILSLIKEKNLDVRSVSSQPTALDHVFKQLTNN